MFDRHDRRQIQRLFEERFTLSDLSRLVAAAGERYESVARQNANLREAIAGILDDAARRGWMAALLAATWEEPERAEGASLA